MKPPAAFKLLEALCLSWLLFPSNCILFRVEMFFTILRKTFFAASLSALRSNSLQSSHFPPWGGVIYRRKEF